MQAAVIASSREVERRRREGEEGTVSSAGVRRRQSIVRLDGEQRRS